MVAAVTVVLSAAGLRKAFGGLVAVNGMGLHLDAGEIVGALDQRTVTCVIIPNDLASMPAQEMPPHEHGTIHSSVGWALNWCTCPGRPHSMPNTASRA